MFLEQRPEWQPPWLHLHSPPRSQDGEEEHTQLACQVGFTLVV